MRAHLVLAVVAFLLSFAGAAAAQPSAPRMTVHYVDVGQGAAAVLEFPCGVILIDAGGGDAAATSGPRLVGYLNALFERRPDLPKRLDAVFITHTHIDHNVALKTVGMAFPIGSYVHNGVARGSGDDNARWMTTIWAPAHGTVDRPIAQTEVDANLPYGLTDTAIDPLTCTGAGPDPVIRVLSGCYDNNPGWPQGEFLKNGNLQSLVIRVDYGAASFLFTGDLEDAAIETLLERVGPTGLLDADIYAAGHHGSYNGTTAGLVTAISPEGAVISAGDPEERGIFTAWAFGHPRRTLVEMLDGVIDTRGLRPGLAASPTPRKSSRSTRCGTLSSRPRGMAPSSSRPQATRLSTSALPRRETGRVPLLRVLRLEQTRARVLMALSRSLPLAPGKAGPPAC